METNAESIANFYGLTVYRVRDQSSTDCVPDQSLTDRVPDRPPSLKHLSEEWEDDDDVEWIDEDIGWADEAADESGDLIPEFPTETSASTDKPTPREEPKPKDTKQISTSIDRVPDQPPSLKHLSEEWDDDDDVEWIDEDIEWVDEAVDDAADDLLSEFPTEISASTNQSPTYHVSDRPPSLKQLSEEWDDDTEWADDTVDDAGDEARDLLPEFPTEISASLAKPIKEAPKTKRIKHDWTSQELKRLLEAVRQSQDKSGPIDWAKVTSRFPHRTLQSCIDVYTKTTGTDDRAQRLAQCKVKMSTEDEQNLVEIIRRRGECDWDGVSMELMESTGIAKGSFYLKTLWSRRLCPKAQTAPRWTRDYTEQLKHVLKTHGNEPAFLTYRFFPQYTPAMISIMIRRLGTDREALDPRESSIPKVKIQRRRPPLHL
ncbi:Myblike DNAbinding domain-containing protein [Coemansia sp. RSA 1199]|nr:Myblike DNAbinding domain-containing protein [Coemansia sp. RSA 1199]